ncbi:hypothetical protein [Streptomyces sp. CA-111067]
MTQPHHTATPPAQRRLRARITPLALLRARAHRHSAPPAAQQRPAREEDR